MKKNITLIASSAFNQFVRFLSIFILMKETSPEIYSQWVTIALIMQYSLFLQLGSPQAMHREIAISLGIGDEKAIYGKTFSALINYFIAMILTFYLLAFFKNSHLLIPTIIYISLIHLGNLFLLHTRAKFETNRSSLAMCIDGFLLIAFAIYLIPIYGILGLLISLCIGAIANIVICMPFKLFKFLNLNFISDIPRNSFLLIKQGIPLLVFNFLILLRDSWDFILINSFYTEDYILYSSSHIFVRGISVIGSLLGLIFIPIIAKNYGELKKIYNIKNLLIVKKLTLSLFIGVIFLVILWVSVSDILIKNLLPNFYDSIDIIIYRTVSSISGLILLPIYFFYNSSRKSIVPITFTLCAIALSLITFFILKNIFDINLSMVISIFVGNIIIIISFILYFYQKIPKN